MFQRSRAKLTRRGLILLAVALASGLAGWLRPAAPVYAQARLVSLVSQDNGHVALGLALRRLGVVGTFMQTAAHPDDEHNQLYALFTLGQGLRSIDVQTTRGEGGQNEIGPELFRDIGVLRTSELLAAHRLDGAEQWFTRAIDYGYSFDPAGGLREVGARRRGGRLRPADPDAPARRRADDEHPGPRRRPRARGDSGPDARGVPRGGRSGAVTPSRSRPACGRGRRRSCTSPAAMGFGGSAAAGDAPAPAPAGHSATRGRRRLRPAARPHLPRDRRRRPQQPQVPGHGSARRRCRAASAAGEASAGPSRYQLVDSTIPGQMDKDETSLFDGIDTSLAGLASFAGPNPPEALKAGLAAIAEQAQPRAEGVRRGRRRGDGRAGGGGSRRAARAARAARLDGARRERAVRNRLPPEDQGGGLRERRAAGRHGLAFEALADDGLVIAGQPVKLSFAVVNRGAADVAVERGQRGGLRRRPPAARRDREGRTARSPAPPTSRCRTTPGSPSPTGPTSTGTRGRRRPRSTSSRPTSSSACRSARRRSA